MRNTVLRVEYEMGTEIKIEYVYMYIYTHTHIFIGISISINVCVCIYVYVYRPIYGGKIDSVKWVKNGWGDRATWEGDIIRKLKELYLRWWKWYIWIDK